MKGRMEKIKHGNGRKGKNRGEARIGQCMQERATIELNRYCCEGGIEKLFNTIC